MVFIGVTKNFSYLTTQEYNHIIRIIGNDILGEKKILVGLTQIKGVGLSFANAILGSLKINPNTNIGYLSESQIKSIEQILLNPKEASFPTWFFNRRKDAETGEDKHILTSDIGLIIRNDIERERITGSWRGYRHMFGLKVRGQRTRCTGRKGGAVGVAKGGKVMPARGGAGAPPSAEAEASTTPATAEDKSAPAEGKSSPAEKKESPVEKKE